MTDIDYHKIIFGLSEDDMTDEVKADDTGWLESDYQEALHLAHKLETSNRKCFEEFLTKITSANGLDKLGLHSRCRLIYTFLSSYIDWRETKFGSIRIKDTRTTMFFEKIHKKNPIIDLDFQLLLDAVLGFSPSSDQISKWGEVVAHGLMHPLPPEEVTPGIVPGAGAKMKPGRKPKPKH